MSYSPSDNAGVAFVIGTASAWECIAFACSSPQTAELNIKKREESLLYWVHAGQALTAITIGIGAMFTKKTRVPLIAGGLFGMASAEVFYLHAKRRGNARRDLEPTEDWDKDEKGGFVYG